jgi:phosphoadenosine phosphosulfate reductase
MKPPVIGALEYRKGRSLMNSADHPLTPADAAALNMRFEHAPPSDIVRWACATFGQRLAMTSSFGADAMCMIHLATQAMPGIPIIFVNTGYLFPETLAFMEDMRQKYRLNVHEFHTSNDPVVWLSVNGEPDPHVRRNIPACCGANKNPVMDRAMATLRPAAFLRGVRSGQTAERAGMNIVEWMDRYQAWAISPILRWNTQQVFQYMRQHDLPHHPLWEQGYVSIGCNPVTCTRPVILGEDERAGRWSGSDKKECGINLDLGRDI